jgi:hypothetical protein
MSASRKTQHSLRDDVALNLRGTACDGARISADVAREPASREKVWAVRVIARCERWTAQAIDACGVQSVPEGILLCLRPEHLQYRDSRYVPLAGAACPSAAEPSRRSA